MKKSPDISVIIPTYNRADLLRECLVALHAQSLDRSHYEILVIDDGSEDDTMAMLAELRETQGVSFRCFHQQKQYSGSARNLGIGNAETDIILSMDDDIIADRYLVERHLEYHRNYPEDTAVILGKILPDSDSVELCEFAVPKLNVIDQTEQNDFILHYTHFATANLSFKKRFFEQSGMFTPGLPRLDDLDLAHRMREQGMNLVHCPEAIGVHKKPLNSLTKVIVSGIQYGNTLAEWYDDIPTFRQEIENFGARLNGGWHHFSSHPVTYLKDATLRMLVNAYTINFVKYMASQQDMTNPPSPLLVRLSLEIWAYYYRSRFRWKRRNIEMKNRLEERLGQSRAHVQNRTKSTGLRPES